MSGILFQTWQQIARELVKLGGNYMSVSEDRENVAPAVQQAAAVAPVADPGPLGLAAFALTTFLLSAHAAHWMSGNSAGTAFLGYAFAYGGLVQLLAGMWEFRNKNVFGATAFATYGGFWIGIFVWIRSVPNALTATGHDLGWIVLAFLIFNTYMMLMAAQVNLAVFGVFLTLELTELFIVIGNFTDGGAGGLSQFSGYLGVITALVAWYTSMAGVANGLNGRLRFPVGKPLI